MDARHIITWFTLPDTYWWIGITGLLISVTASVMLFLGTPRDSTGFEMPTISIDAHFYGPSAKQAMNRRYKLSKTGFALLIAGGALQFISLIGQCPHN